MCFQEQELNRRKLQDNTLDIDNFDLDIFQNAEFLNDNDDNKNGAASERKDTDLNLIWDDCEYNAQGKKIKK